MRATFKDAGSWLAAIAVGGSFVLGCGTDGSGEVGRSADALVGTSQTLPNNHPVENAGGKAASFSKQGSINFDSEFFHAQGSNGRSCVTCHNPDDGWSMSAATVQRLFEETDGLHPIFANNLDADKPSAPVGTVEERRAAFTQLLQGKFVRRNSVPVTAEFTVIGISDPFNESSSARLQFFRRSMPTANFLSHQVSWDGANTSGTDLRAGLERQANGNVTGAQQGAQATAEVIDDIVDFEMNLTHAQLIVPGVGRLDSDGARGGPEALSTQPLVAGRFDLYDAWRKHGNPRRAQIARGQDIFNSANAGNGRSCLSCHNAANDGQNVAGMLFDIGASNVEFAKADMAVFTLQNKETGETIQTTDPGRALRSGRWSDMNRFKTPSLRGVAARGGYFHNGIAGTLEEVVRFYEQSLGFTYTDADREDLVAFLNAL